MPSCSAALGTVSGPLHGKAAIAVHELLAEAGSSRSPEGAVARLVGRGEPVPGFGHTVYQGPDPRAVCLFELLEPLWSQRARATVEGVLAAAARTTDAAPDRRLRAGGAGVRDPHAPGAY